MTPKEQAQKYAAAHGFDLRYDSAMKRVMVGVFMTASYADALAWMHNERAAKRFAPLRVAQPLHIVKPWVLIWYGGYTLDGERPRNTRHANRASALATLRAWFNMPRGAEYRHLMRVRIAYHPHP